MITTQAVERRVDLILSAADAADEFSELAREYADRGAGVLGGPSTTQLADAKGYLYGALYSMGQARMWRLPSATAAEETDVYDAPADDDEEDEQ